MTGLEQEVQNQRGQIDELMNQLKELNIDSLKENIKQEVEQESIERDRPPGSPYFTFLVDDDPNVRFPGTTWVRIEENTYLVSAGANLVGMTPVGANSKDIHIDWSHNHPQNPHSHENYNRTSNFSSTGNQYGGRMGTAGDNSGTITATAPTTATNQSAGTQTNTQTVDNRPKSVAIYVWRRTA